MEFMSSLQDGFDNHKPSLFELLSEQQLSSLLPPSLRYLLTVATHRHPRYLLPILNSFDEVYALLMLAVERHYLLVYGGGFTENFYGLKRERALRIKGGEAPRTQLGSPGLMRETLKLRPSDVWKNLAVIVGLPYLKRKLDESHDIHVPQATILGPIYRRDSIPPNATLRERIMYYYKWFLRHVYPSVNAAYYFSLLAFHFAYLFDNSKYHSPFLWLIGTRIRRLGEADHRAIAAALEPSLPASRPGARPGESRSIFGPRNLMTSVYPRMLSSLKLLLPTSIFALKFLEWWHASDFARQLSRKVAEGLELPPPTISGLAIPPFTKVPVSTASSSLSTVSQPVTNMVSLSSAPLTSSNLAVSKSNSQSLSRDQNFQPPISSITFLPILTVPSPKSSTSRLCPICLHSIKTPTAAQTGYVFCYTCIFKWLDGSHDRQSAFMEGTGGEEGWVEEYEGGKQGKLEGKEEIAQNEDSSQVSRREGKWDSGRGRCAVTGRRVLGGTEGLRRVMV